MKLNDKLKSEMRTLINEPPYERIVPYYLVNSKRLDDIIDQTITATIKHCAEVVGEAIGYDYEKEERDPYDLALEQAKQRLLDLI